jgi:hypothetical protein
MYRTHNEILAHAPPRGEPRGDSVSGEPLGNCARHTVTHVSTTHVSSRTCAPDAASTLLFMLLSVGSALNEPERRRSTGSAGESERTAVRAVHTTQHAAPGYTHTAQQATHRTARRSWDTECQAKRDCSADLRLRPASSPTTHCSTRALRARTYVTSMHLQQQHTHTHPTMRAASPTAHRASPAAPCCYSA